MVAQQKTLDVVLSQGTFRIVERVERPLEMCVQFDSGMLCLESAIDRPYDLGLREYAFKFSLKRRGQTAVTVYEFLPSDVGRSELRVRVLEDIRPVAQYRVTVK
ncbi:TPA: hypothetical protein HA251_00040 [Candidatus Woesearchaeota archaeon]|nr:hypothetical protein [Candidatus Woesearchaeota archaeon]